MSSFKTSFKAPGQVITIERIEHWDRNGDYKWLPISNEAYFHVSRLLDTEDSCFLPKLYAALKYLTGPSDDWYDDFKGSYSFMFMLNVQNNGTSDVYLYHLRHVRSYIDFSLYHRVPKTDPRDPQYMHPADDKLFSNQDITAFSYCFCKKMLQSLERAQCQPNPFVRWSDSNFLLFGFADGKYFLDSYQDQAQYEKEKEHKKSLLHF